jgi:thiol:disulfide interchange protein DsbD
MVGMVVLGLVLGAIHASFHASGFERVRKGLGVALATIGLFGLTNYALSPKGDTHLAWLSDEAAAVADARAGNRPLLVDFSASWCLPCKELEVQVFARPEVAKVMSRFTLLRLDLTKEEDDARLAPVKRKYGAETLPAVRIVGRDGTIVGRTDRFVPADQFLELLAAAKP